MTLGWLLLLLLTLGRCCWGLSLLATLCGGLWLLGGCALLLLLAALGLSLTPLLLGLLLLFWLGLLLLALRL